MILSLLTLICVVSKLQKRGGGYFYSRDAFVSSVCGPLRAFSLYHSH